MSPTYIASIAALLAYVLPMFGIRVGTEEITALIQAIIVIVSIVTIAVRRYQKGDITPLGAYKA